MAKGFFLSDNVLKGQWTAATAIQGAGSDTYVNAASNVNRVFDPTPASLWSSAENSQSTRQELALEFTWGRPLFPSFNTLAILDFQVLGALTTVGGVDQRASLDGIAPVVQVRPNNPSDAAWATIPLQPWVYEQLAATVGGAPSNVTLYRSDMLLALDETVLASAPRRLNLRVTAGATHSLRIPRIVIGQRYTFPRNVSTRFRVRRQDPYTFNRDPGAYSNPQGPTGGAGLPFYRNRGFRTLEGSFLNITKAQVDAMTRFFHLNGGSLPFIVCFDPDNIETMVYARIVDWTDTFVRKIGTEEYHELACVFEEVSR